jgi:quercetin dioxygenase-like cupin family protein
MAEEPNFIVHNHVELGRSFPGDCDALITRFTSGSMLLIHVPPQEGYAYEVHAAPEYIICLNGTLKMESQHGQAVSVNAGDMIEVPVGLFHRFAADSDAVILTLILDASPQS